MHTNLLQSPNWRVFQELEGKTTFTLSGNNWSALAIQENTPLGPYLFLPYGPALATKSALKPALKALKTLAAAQKAIFIRIEPTLPFSPQELKPLGLKKTKNINPQHTWILDLTPDKPTLLAGMRQSIRNPYNNYHKKTLTIKTTEDPAKISILTNLQGTVARRNNFTPHSKTYLKHQLQSGLATLYYIQLDQKPIAAAICLDTETTRYYAHAAADYKHRNLNAGSTLLVQMILDARQRGKKFFDFWGITPSENPKHPWFGFTEFKKGFGGEPKTYSGTYDLPVNPAKYRLYTLLRHANLAVRRLKRP